ncbi:MauE/DoxX family redox-associated membrane protein [Lipingzhangella rawalii]|uniref:MauE/DoxX family redox-associated membrane protein n=1 Tax=Lipingzhangella rawalii TaxID=2055835 RepID=UPI0038990359
MRSRNVLIRTLPAWDTAQPWVTLLARLALAGVLGYAGLSKVTAPVVSVQAVEAYELLPPELARVVGYTLPAFEIALAVLLLLGLATRYVGALTAVLMVVFTAGIVSAWARGLSIDCGCFGSGGQVPPGEADYVTPLLRDLGFVLLAGIVMIWPRSPLSADQAFGLYPAQSPTDRFASESTNGDDDEQGVATRRPGSAEG